MDILGRTSVHLIIQHDGSMLCTFSENILHTFIPHLTSPAAYLMQSGKSMECALSLCYSTFRFMLPWGLSVLLQHVAALILFGLAGPTSLSCFLHHLQVYADASTQHCGIYNGQRAKYANYLSFPPSFNQQFTFDEILHLPPPVVFVQFHSGLM